MSKEKDHDLIWKSRPEIIKGFLEQREDYEQLCAEIAYILKKRLIEENVEYSTVSNRAKSLKSFLGKISRKNYSDPIKDITDFAGVRVVYLYQHDLAAIEAIIKKEFSIIERVDKLNEKGTDKFGYGAIHFIVKIGKNSSGARYDSLKNLVCEIQVRTVLQDAWAIIDHHLAYKSESDVPSNLQRKLNSLAGLFETADNQFESIRQERSKYLKVVAKSANTDAFLDNELNLDTFEAYLKWKFPEYETKYFERQVSIVFNQISKAGLNSLKALDKIVEKRKFKLEQLEQMLIERFGSGFFMGNKMSSSLYVSFLLSIENDKYLDIAGTYPGEKEFFRSLRK
jgi:putative GTP pyrophosphokinase